MTSREFSPTQPVILGFDPGRDKCGLAVLGFDPGRDKCGLAVMGLDRQLYTKRRLLCINLLP